MKKTLFLLIISLCTKLAVGGDLKLFYYYSTYFHPQTGPYLETYMTVIGNTAEFKSVENGKFQAEIEVTMIFKQNGEVKDFRKYILKSPVNDTTGALPNFIDQQRISLPAGSYNFELKVKDLNKTDGRDIIFYDIITLNFVDTEVRFSGIEFVESYKATVQENILSRNGVDLVPYVSDFYPENIKHFVFYAEVYFTNKILGNDTEFLLMYYIEPSSQIAPLPEFIAMKKVKAADVIPVLGEFPIQNLSSGNYNLVIEVKNRENKVVGQKKIFFQRSNPKPAVDWNKLAETEISGTFVEKYTNPDSLKYFIACLYPISSDDDLSFAKNAIRSDSVFYMQKFIYVFWKSRNNNDPESEWKKYKEQVEFVQKNYGTQIRKGFETDRGRVYLKYGCPDNIIESKHEPSAYPYEIWHYYLLGEQRDKRFVFYNPQLVGDDYTLLHSDAKGEVYDKNWERRLQQRNNSMYNPDATESDGGWGSKAGENWNK
jgi:GWxTD domain-containing protein